MRPIRRPPTPVLVSLLPLLGASGPLAAQLADADHREYHTPDDEAELADPDHMAAVVDAAVEMVRGLASGPRPAWKEGGRPEPGGR